MSQIFRARFFVERIHNRVYLRSLDDEYEMAMEIPRYVRMFGIRHLKAGYYCTIAVKRDKFGKTKMRGWSYKRKWTAEDIALAEQKANELHQALTNCN